MRQSFKFYIYNQSSICNYNKFLSHFDFFFTSFKIWAMVSLVYLISSFIYLNSASIFRSISEIKPFCFTCDSDND